MVLGTMKVPFRYVLGPDDAKILQIKFFKIFGGYREKYIDFEGHFW